MRLCRLVFVMTGALLITHLAVAPVAVGAEEGAKTTTSWTFEKIWYRTEKNHPFKRYRARGTLIVSATALEFRAEKLELHIPTAAIHAVSVGTMKGQVFQWVFVDYERDGVAYRVGFGPGRDTVAIHDAFRRVLLVARGEAAGERSPVETLPITLEQYPQRMTWKEFYRQIDQGFPPAPKRLVTDPASVGLLLIDAYLTQALQHYPADGIVLVRKGDKAYVFRAGSFSPGPVWGGPDGLVLFTGLEPGEYVVRIVHGWSSTIGTLSVEMAPHPDLTVRIEAGKVHYLGRLRIKRKRKTQDVERQHDPAREAKVLNLFAEEYADTPWATLARERARAARR